MNDSASPSAPVTREDGTPGQRPRFGFGSGVCGLFLAAGNLVSVYVTFLAYMATPAGPWDSETVAHSNIASGLVLLLSLGMALLTWVCVKAEWLRRWWYVLPAVMAVAALLRLTLFVPEF
ncbi:hypothetical protein ACIRFH_05650 [Streptomyces sp. NPDC093586]|uniref:hypothetical protein n=1 Tax=Streptomyces sp. NPDC093586 TaxID=3366042 RepID=UPI00381DA748